MKSIDAALEWQAEDSEMFISGTYYWKYKRKGKVFAQKYHMNLKKFIGFNNRTPIEIAIEVRFSKTPCPGKLDIFGVWPLDVLYGIQILNIEYRFHHIGLISCNNLRFIIVVVLKTTISVVCTYLS